jgi:hypothetical protein
MKTSSTTTNAADTITTGSTSHGTTTTSTTTTTTATLTTTTTTTATTATDRPVWTRPNYKGIYHDNRRLLKHRAKNCECCVCYREIYKLPPAETHTEYVSSLKTKIEEREIKRAKKKAKKEVKNGKQGTIDKFFGAF